MESILFPRGGVNELFLREGVSEVVARRVPIVHYLTTAKAPRYGLLPDATAPRVELSTLAKSTTPYVFAS